MPENISDSIKWLLEFANLSCETGKINFQSLDFIPILQRPPLKPPKNFTIPPLPHTSQTITDDDGNEWLPAWGNPIFLGKFKYPSRLEFETFFIRQGAKESIKIFLGKGRRWVFIFQDDRYYPEDLRDMDALCDTEYYLRSFWIIARRSLFSMMGGERGFNVLELWESITRRYGELSGEFPSDIKGSIFKHDGTMPYLLYSILLDVQVNHKEYHSYFRVCHYCGTFRLSGDNKRGRGQKYCSTACKNSFNRVSLERDIQNKKSGRNHRRKNAKTQIINYLVKNQNTRSEAERIYGKEKEEHPKNVASLKEF